MDLTGYGSATLPWINNKFQPYSYLICLMELFGNDNLAHFELCLGDIGPLGQELPRRCLPLLQLGLGLLPLLLLISFHHLLLCEEELGLKA